MKNHLSVGINNWQEMVSSIAATKVKLSGYLNDLLSATPAEFEVVAFSIEGKLKLLPREFSIVQDFIYAMKDARFTMGPGNYLYMLERRIDVVLLQRLIERAKETAAVFDRSMRSFVPAFSAIEFAESNARGYNEFARDPHPHYEKPLANLEECNAKFLVFSFRHSHIIVEALAQEGKKNRTSLNVEQLLGEIDTLEILHNWLVSLYTDLNSQLPALNVSELIDLNWDPSIVPSKDLEQAAAQHFQCVLTLTLSWVESIELRLAKLQFN
jgi:hypothetical protein